ncbi:MAG TPA: hypothetical protein PLC54_07040, partial [Spirochaetales bacterium]|nr:hypothetical protein [Spirochaetales bacterium]
VEGPVEKVDYPAARALVAAGVEVFPVKIREQHVPVFRIYCDERFRLLWLLGTSSPQLSPQEAEIQWKRDADGTSFWDKRADHDYSAGSESIKLFAYHLIEWRALDSLRVGLAELAVMGGASPGLNFILPGLVWHNTYAAGYSNVTMAAIASWVPFAGFLVSAQFLMDDITSPDESAAADKPGAYAWHASASWSPRIDGDKLLVLAFEYNHADRWTYVRLQPYLSMYQRNILPGGFRGIDTPLGSPYGPDSDQLGLSARYRAGRGLTLSASVEYVRKGPIRMGMIEESGGEFFPVYFDLDSYIPDRLGEILSRPDEHRFITDLSVDAAISQSLFARLRLSWGLYRNYGNQAAVNEYLVLVYAGVGWVLE